MKRIANMFAQKKENVLIPYLTTGDPNLSFTKRLLHALEKAGADAVELGVPYSDPLADGPVIQRASQRALQQGVRLRDVIRLGEEVRQEGLTIPLILFTYYNPVLQNGVERIFTALEHAGFDGVIIPDLPHEESGEVRKFAELHSLAYIPLIAPTSKHRIEKVVQQATGFVYCVSSLGVTGERTHFYSDLDQFLATARTFSSVPLCVGFGVRSPEQVDELNRIADGVIVGSALIRRIEELYESDLSEEEMIERLCAYFRQLKYGHLLF